MFAYRLRTELSKEGKLDKRNLALRELTTFQITLSTLKWRPTNIGMLRKLGDPIAFGGIFPNITSIIPGQNKAQKIII